MADERCILAVSDILSLFSALAAAFQCCGVLLSLLIAKPPPEAVNGHIVLVQIFTRFGTLANVT